MPTDATRRPSARFAAALAPAAVAAAVAATCMPAGAKPGDLVVLTSRVVSGQGRESRPAHLVIREGRFVPANESAPGAPVLDINDFVVLHFQFILWERMVSKHRWYQAWEHQKNPNKGALEIFRGFAATGGALVTRRGIERDEVHLGGESF